MGDPSMASLILVNDIGVLYNYILVLNLSVIFFFSLLVLMYDYIAHILLKF